jgi:hypothetical protein
MEPALQLGPQLLLLGNSRTTALRLDTAGYLPPTKYLEKRCAEQVKLFNRQNSNSKVGPIKTWAQLVSREDKDYLRGMRRLLSRCAKSVSNSILPLSGN